VKVQFVTGGPAVPGPPPLGRQAAKPSKNSSLDPGGDPNVVAAAYENVQYAKLVAPKSAVIASEFTVTPAQSPGAGVVCADVNTTGADAVPFAMIRPPEWFSLT
jgi:hypothetical protein